MGGWVGGWVSYLVGGDVGGDHHPCSQGHVKAHPKGTENGVDVLNGGGGENRRACCYEKVGA